MIKLGRLEVHRMCQLVKFTNLLLHAFLTTPLGTWGHESGQMPSTDSASGRTGVQGSTL